MLNKYELPTVREEAERCDTLRYSWQKLQAHASEVSAYLSQIQPNFKDSLIADVKVFVDDCFNFYSDYGSVSVSSLSLPLPAAPIKLTFLIIVLWIRQKRKMAAFFMLEL